MFAQRTYAQGYDLLFFFIPSRTVGNITFADNTATPIEHAVALKRYNGLGLQPIHDYCEFTISDSLWHFYEWARYINSSGNLDSNNYVESICTVTE